MDETKSNKVTSSSEAQKPSPSKPVGDTGPQASLQIPVVDSVGQVVPPSRNTLAAALDVMKLTKSAIHAPPLPPTPAPAPAKPPIKATPDRVLLSYLMKQLRNPKPALRKDVIKGLCIRAGAGTTVSEKEMMDRVRATPILQQVFDQFQWDKGEGTPSANTPPAKKAKTLTTVSDRLLTKTFRRRPPMSQSEVTRIVAEQFYDGDLKIALNRIQQCKGESKVAFEALKANASPHNVRAILLVMKQAQSQQAALMKVMEITKTDRALAMKIIEKNKQLNELYENLAKNLAKNQVGGNLSKEKQVVGNLANAGDRRNPFTKRKSSPKTPTRVKALTKPKPRATRPSSSKPAPRAVDVENPHQTTPTGKPKGTKSVSAQNVRAMVREYLAGVGDGEANVKDVVTAMEKKLTKPAVKEHMRLIREECVRWNTAHPKSPVRSPVDKGKFEMMTRDRKKKKMKMQRQSKGASDGSMFTASKRSREKTTTDKPKSKDSSDRSSSGSIIKRTRTPAAKPAAGAENEQEEIKELQRMLAKVRSHNVELKREIRNLERQEKALLLEH